MLFFGVMVCFDFIEGDCQFFICYISNVIDIYWMKLECVDDLYCDYVGELLFLLSWEDVVDMFEWIWYEFCIKCGSQFDVFIFGLGWIKVNGENGVFVVVYVLKGI